jgi:steroid delta-isomerase-like uncharacterized protein
MAGALDVDAYMDAWNARNLDRLMDFYAEDAELEQTGFPVTRGKDGIRNAYATLLDAMRETHGEILKHVTSGNVTAARVRVHATFIHDLTLPGVTLPAKGKSLTWDLANFVTVNADGKIRREVTIVNQLDVMQQIGVSPEDLKPRV